VYAESLSVQPHRGAGQDAVLKDVPATQVVAPTGGVNDATRPEAKPVLTVCFAGLHW
jgi:hypothetical protein